MVTEIIKGNDNPVAEFFSSPSSTPETDAYAKADWWTLFRATEHGRILERERDKARVDAAQLADRLSGLELRTTEELARMERERDDARTTIEDAKRALNATEYEGILLSAMRVKEERDEAKEQVKELIYIALRAISLAEIDFENDKFGIVSELRDGVERIKEGAK